MGVNSKRMSVYAHMSSADLIKQLKANGFALVRSGSHHKLRNATGVTIIVSAPKEGPWKRTGCCDTGTGRAENPRKRAARQPDDKYG
jgi:predicted RNA binding protein YcfA (HicA-like mRNA interferase family)